MFVTQPNTVPSNNKFCFSLPYFGAQSEKPRTKLTILLRNLFINVDLNIILVNKFKMGKLSTYNVVHTNLVVHNVHQNKLVEQLAHFILALLSTTVGAPALAPLYLFNNVP